MKKKKYTKPKLHIRKIDLGVFGSYGSSNNGDDDDHDGGCGGGSHWWGWWWSRH